MSAHDTQASPARYALFDVLMASGVNDPDSLGASATAFEMGARMALVATAHARRWLALRDAESTAREMLGDKELRQLAEGLVGLTEARRRA